jgi:hypothetical protein
VFTYKDLRIAKISVGEVDGISCDVEDERNNAGKSDELHCLKYLAMKRSLTVRWEIFWILCRYE